MNTEDLLKKATARKSISSYAINGPRYEINTGRSLIKCDEAGALQELKDLDPGLFEEVIVNDEVPVEKQKRKRVSKEGG
jgi:hypothetical protein